MTELTPPQREVTVTVGELVDLTCLHLQDDRQKLVDTILRVRPLLPTPSNLNDALDIVHQIDRVRAVQRELKAAFARSDLDGGAKAAVDHPLFQQAARKLTELHDALMEIV